MQEEEREELLRERYELVRVRIHEISREEVIPAPFSDYFKKTAEFLLLMEELKERVAAGRTKMAGTPGEGQQLAQEAEIAACPGKNSMADAGRYPGKSVEAGRGSLVRETFMDSLELCQEWNERLYCDILPDNYEASYGNPAYAVKKLGDTYGRILSFLYTELRGLIVYVYEERFEEQVVLLELFMEIYTRFEEEELPSYRELQQIVYWFVSDYAELFAAHRVREAVDPDLEFATRIVMDSDLTDLRYLYQYGEYVSEYELQMAEFMNRLPEKEICAMADTFTEGYRIGFLADGKDISIIKSVNIRYSLGFERMIRQAVRNFAKMGLRPVIYRSAVSTINKKQQLRIGYTGAVPNPQFDYDHRADSAVYLDKRLIERKLGVMRSAYGTFRKEAKEQGGSAVVEVFGGKPFSPAAKPEAYHLSEKQQKLVSFADNEASQLANQYMAGKERSFTSIAFPVPQIGAQFEEIFHESVRSNTPDCHR